MEIYVVKPGDTIDSIAAALESVQSGLFMTIS